MQHPRSSKRRTRQDDPDEDDLSVQMDMDLEDDKPLARATAMDPPDTEESEGDRENRLKREAIAATIEAMEGQERPDTELLQAMKDKLKACPKPASIRAAKDRQVLATQVWKGELKLQDVKKEAEQRVQKATNELKQVKSEMAMDLEELRAKHEREIQTVQDDYQKQIHELEERIRKANEKVDEAVQSIREKQIQYEEVIGTIKVEIPGKEAAPTIDMKCSIQALDQQELARKLVAVNTGANTDLTEAQAQKAVAMILEQAGQLALKAQMEATNTKPLTREDIKAATGADANTGSAEASLSQQKPAGGNSEPPATAPADEKKG